MPQIPLTYNFLPTIVTLPKSEFLSVVLINLIRREETVCSGTMKALFVGEAS